MIYAPGRYTGYGAKTLPGIREAIEEERWDDVTTYVKYNGWRARCLLRAARQSDCGSERLT